MFECEISFPSTDLGERGRDVTRGAKTRGSLFRQNPNGSQKLAGGVRGDWWVSYKCALGHRHREKVGPKGRAIEEHHRLRLQVRREGYCPRLKKNERPLLFEDAAKEYLEWSEAHKKSHETDEHWLNRLKVVFASKTLAEITPEGVERFKQSLAEERTKATVNRHLACLRHLFNRAIRRGIFSGRNPVSLVGLFREENTRTRWLSEEEEKKLLAVIPEPYKSFCTVALYTGARRGELLAARWDQVEARRGLLTLPTSKNGRPRHIELSSLVLDTLARVPRHVDSSLIFPDCRKVTHRFPAWATEAKLPGKVTLHTLRHTFASRLVMAGVDLLTVRELGGWGEKGGLAMVERYAHVAAGHKREAIEALAQGTVLRVSGTQSGTGTKTASQGGMAKVG
jgi:integrase